MNYRPCDYFPKYDVRTPFMVRLLTLMERPFSEFTVRFMLGSKVLKLLESHEIYGNPPPKPSYKI